MIYPALFLFVATAAFSSWSLWWSWLEQSRGWRIGYLVFIAFEVALAAWECSFAMVPVREWIRVDLLLTLPMTLLTAVSLLVRHALLLTRKRRREIYRLGKR